jgi:uncharacterized protein (DUF1800 family)
VILAGLALPGAAGAQVPGQATDPELHLLRRATFGVRPADLEEARSLGIEVWLDRQLHPARIDDSGLDGRLAAFPAASKSIAELVRDYSPPRPQPQDSAARETMTPAERRMRAAMSPARILADMTGAKLTRAVWSERQLEEVMTDFWFNHFNVYFGKGLDRYLVSDYERSAIRPHVFGTFEDMLLATAQHPAMLFYLDQWTSFAPDSVSAARDLEARRDMTERLSGLTPAQRDRMIRSGRVTREQLDRVEQMRDMQEQRQRRERGMNENYARELLELHTLGVDGGYTQDDVIVVARAFTGWTFVPTANRRNTRPATARTMDGGGPGLARRPNAAEPGTFQFRHELHDIEEKVVLGRTLEAGRGIEDGLDVIHMVATHPSTARHIATKLIERFVSDAPDPAFVDELANVFMKSDGDLREVTRALFVSPRFYDASIVGAKVKTPFELVASALRVTYAEVGLSPRLVQTLRQLGQLPYDETAPTGYPASSEEWVNSGAMLNRMNFALELASGRLPGVRPDGQRLVRDRNADPDTAVPDLIDLLIPGMRTDALVSAIRADLMEQAESGAARRALAVRAMGLTLGSPQFQRR